MKNNLSGQFDRIPNHKSVQFILLHFIQPYEEKPFAEFLKWLTSVYDVVSYGEAIRRINSGTVERATAAISFDDGLKDNLVASRIMLEHGVKGCFFVVPDIIGETDQTKLKQFCEQRLLYAHTDSFMNWDEIESLKDAGHEIGNHTKSHLYLMDLSENEFLSQVGQGRDEIKSKLGSVEHFSWPYGRFWHFKRHWVDKIFEMGHTSCASAERGSHLSACDTDIESKINFCLLRDSLEMNWPLSHCKYFLANSTCDGKSPQAVWPVTEKI